MDTDAFLPKLVIGSFPLSLVRFPHLDPSKPDRLTMSFSPPLVGYSTYAWAKKHDAYLNSKEGHIAHSGEH